MLSRDQVLHVARLARLELTDDEQARFAGELSKVARLHRDDRRARRPRRRRSRPRTSSPSRTRCAPTSRGRRCRASVALASAPDAADGGFRVPSPGAGADDVSTGTDILELTAAQAAERVRAGDLDAERALARLPRPRAGRRPERVHVGLRRGRARRCPTARPLGGVPIGVKDLFCTEGIPSQAGSRILEDYRPPYTATSVERLNAAGRADARQDQPGRVRDGLLDRELRVRADAEPVGPHARARRLVAAARPPRWRPAWCRGRSAPTPAARSASPPRCAGSSASSRPTARSAATG